VSVCPHSRGRMSWSIFAKSDTEVTTHKNKNEFVGVNITPPFYFAPKNPNFGAVNRRFQAKLAELHRFQLNFAQG